MFSKRFYLVASNLENNSKFLLNNVNNRKISIYSPLCNVDQTEKQRQFAVTNEIKQETINNRTVLDTKFESTDIAYGSKTNSDLLRGLFVFNMCSIDYFINNQIKVIII
jgi:hypothetical protein